MLVPPWLVTVQEIARLWPIVAVAGPVVAVTTRSMSGPVMVMATARTLSVSTVSGW